MIYNITDCIIILQVLAFNAAGDGPRSTAVLVRTLQGLPSAPRNITFTDITMNSLVVTWQPPYRRNGLIQSYLVTYETIEQDERKSLVKTSLYFLNVL